MIAFTADPLSPERHLPEQDLESRYRVKEMTDENIIMTYCSH